MRLTCFLLLLTAVNSFLLQYNHERKISNPNTFALSSVATQNEDLSSPTRREFLSSSAAGIIVGSGCLRPSSVSAEENLGDFEDATWKFSIKVPTGWEQSVQSLPDRRKIVLYIKPDSNQKTLCFIAYTPVRADFTSLGSFGSVDAVAQATILPKQEIAGVLDVSSKMLKAESKKQAYFFDYVTKVPQQPETHFRTIFTLANGAGDAAGSTLVTITVQSPESEYEGMMPLFDKIMDSFKYSG